MFSIALSVADSRCETSVDGMSVQWHLQSSKLALADPKIEEKCTEEVFPCLHFKFSK